MMKRAKYIRFLKDANPMAPGRAANPIGKAMLIITDKDGQDTHARSQDRSVRMDEILVSENWVYLRNQDGARWVPRDAVADFEPLDPAPPFDDEPDHLELDVPPAKTGKENKR